MRVPKDQIEAQREEIVKWATVIFSQKGYAATNMADIAKEMGISRTPLYYHFGNKEQLFATVFDEHARRFFSTTHRVYTSDMSIFDKIRTELGTVVEQSEICGERIRGEVRVNRESMPELYEKLKRLKQDIYEVKMEALNTAIEKGEIRSDVDVHELATLIYIYYYGLTSESTSLFMKENEQDIRGNIDAFVQLFENRYGLKNEVL